MNGQSSQHKQTLIHANVSYPFLYELLTSMAQSITELQLRLQYLTEEDGSLYSDVALYNDTVFHSNIHSNSSTNHSQYRSYSNDVYNYCRSHSYSCNNDVWYIYTHSSLSTPPQPLSSRAETTFGSPQSIHFNSSINDHPNSCRGRHLSKHTSPSPSQPMDQMAPHSKNITLHSKYC